MQDSFSKIHSIIWSCTSLIEQHLVWFVLGKTKSIAKAFFYTTREATLRSQYQIKRKKFQVSNFHSRALNFAKGCHTSRSRADFLRQLDGVLCFFPPTAGFSSAYSKTVFDYPSWKHPAHFPGRKHARIIRSIKTAINKRPSALVINAFTFLKNIIFTSAERHRRAFLNPREHARLDCCWCANWKEITAQIHTSRENLHFPTTARQFFST